jgi:hypothetical protein
MRRVKRRESFGLFECSVHTSALVEVRIPSAPVGIEKQIPASASAKLQTPVWANSMAGALPRLKPVPQRVEQKNQASTGISQDRTKQKKDKAFPAKNRTIPGRLEKSILVLDRSAVFLCLRAESRAYARGSMWPESRR